MGKEFFFQEDFFFFFGSFVLVMFLDAIQITKMEFQELDILFRSSEKRSEHDTKICQTISYEVITHVMQSSRSILWSKEHSPLKQLFQNNASTLCISQNYEWNS